MVKVVGGGDCEGCDCGFRNGAGDVDAGDRSFGVGEGVGDGVTSVLVLALF